MWLGPTCLFLVFDIFPFCIFTLFIQFTAFMNDTTISTDEAKIVTHKSDR